MRTHFTYEAEPLEAYTDFELSSRSIVRAVTTSSGCSRR